MPFSLSLSQHSNETLYGCFMKLMNFYGFIKGGHAPLLIVMFLLRFPR